MKKEMYLQWKNANKALVIELCESMAEEAGERFMKNFEANFKLWR